MKKYILSLLVISAFFGACDAAPVNRRGQSAASGGASGNAAARSAVSARAARAPVATSSASSAKTTTAARSATRGPVSGTATTQSVPRVTARAGATQKVVGTGVKVAVAADNTAVDASCQDKFNGCMDTFCMVENASGGRCTCSAKAAELAKQLAEIEKMDSASYDLATIGVETMETGIDIVGIQNAAKKSVGTDLSAWNKINQANDDDDDNDDMFGTKKEQTGVELKNSSAKICMEYIPECAASEKILRTMYDAKIRSDCAAYENAVKEQMTAAQTRMDSAKQEMRRAAYDKLKSDNKYNLGQCTLEFKKCMMDIGGCGSDWKKCVGLVASVNATRTRTATTSAAKPYDIQGAATKISIAASTYDTLESKKPLCDNVTDSCVSVRDQVWMSFLREAAPEIKNAELLAESDVRTSCISNISDCIQKACKDTIDPNDPDGSYDMCLSRPDTVRSFCKVQIDPCVAADELVMDYVYARLASMRVNACTDQVRQCLQSSDRCGSDYTGCVGLDTDTIVRMCPYDKLTGCQKVYGDTDIRGDAVYDELANMVQGIMLNIDNNMLTYCQAAADKSMIRVCGDTANCNALIADDSIGAGSLEYKICNYDDAGNIDYSKCRSSVDQVTDTELGRVIGSTTGALGPTTPMLGVMDGVMFWELVTVGEGGNLTSSKKYLEDAGATAVRDVTKKRIESEIDQLQKSIDDAVAAIESDMTVQFCMTGRQVQGLKDVPEGKVPRFSNLTKQMRQVVAQSALQVAKENYYKKYDELNNRLMSDYIAIAERSAKIKGENEKDVRREAARQACVSLADMAAAPMSPPPPQGWGMWVVVGVAVAAAVALAIFVPPAGALVATTVTLTETGTVVTGAVATTALELGIATATTSLTAAGIATVAVGGLGAAATIGAVAGAASANWSGGNRLNSSSLELTGHHEMKQWNYRQVIDTTFDWDNVVCEKCVVSSKCTKQTYPAFGKPYCKAWSDNKTECSKTQF